MQSFSENGRRISLLITCCSTAATAATTVAIAGITAATIAIITTILFFRCLCRINGSKKSLYAQSDETIEEVIDNQIKVLNDANKMYHDYMDIIEGAEDIKDDSFSNYKVWVI